MKHILVIGIVGFIASCASAPSVKEENEADTLSSLRMSCGSPYPLTQDCSGWSGAKRKITIEGFDVKVAASADGKIILVMDAKLVANTAADMFSFTFNSPTHSKASNNSFYAVRKVLDKEGVKIKRVRPLRSFGNVDGYAVELESDGYTLLKKYSKT